MGFRCKSAIAKGAVRLPKSRCQPPSASTSRTSPTFNSKYKSSKNVRFTPPKLLFLKYSGKLYFSTVLARFDAALFAVSAPCFRESEFCASDRVFARDAGSWNLATSFVLKILRATLMLSRFWSTLHESARLFSRFCE